MLVVLFIVTGCAAPSVTSDTAAATTEAAAAEATEAATEPTEAPAAVEPIQIRLSHVVAEDHPIHIALLETAEKLKEQSNGKYELVIFPNSTYANYKDSLQAVRMNSLEMCCLDSAMDFLPETGALLVPYIFRDLDHWESFTNSDFSKELREQIGEAVGVKEFQFYNHGFRHVTTKGDVVPTTPEEFEGLKLRVVDFAPYPEVATVLNASPTPLPFSEVYMALSQGVVDAQENPLNQIVAMKFYEVQDNLILTGHILAISSIVCSDDFWNSLPAEDQALIEKLFDENSKRIDEIVKGEQDALLEQLKGFGMNVVEVDKQPFMDRVSLVFDKYPEFKDLYDKIQAIN